MNKSIAEKILSLSAAHGIEAAEVFLRSYASTTIEVKEQKVDAFEQANDIGAGLRVIAKGRAGFAFTSDLTGRALTSLAQSAVTNAHNTEADPYAAIPGRPLRMFLRLLSMTRI